MILQVERCSLVIAAVAVTVVTALLLLGCVWFQWCHVDRGGYRYIPASQMAEFVKYQQLAGSEGAGVCRGKCSSKVDADVTTVLPVKHLSPALSRDGGVVHRKPQQHIPETSS